MINRFQNDYYFLSNFYPAEMMYDGIHYQNAEAAFQAQKCADKAERFKFSKLNATEAKKLGREVNSLLLRENISKKEIHGATAYGALLTAVERISLVKS